MEKEEREEKKEKQRNHIWLITVLVIALLVVFFFLGYAVGGVRTTKEVMNKTEKEKTTEVSEEDDEKEEVAEKLLTKDDVSVQLEELEEVTSRFADKYPLKTNELDNQSVLLYAFVLVEKKDSKFSGSDISKVIEGTFGKDYSYELEDIGCGIAGHGALYHYDESGMYSYVDTHPGHGGLGYFRSKIYFVDAKENNDTITINTKILYGGWCSDTCGPTSDFYAKYPFNTSIYKVTDDSDDYDKVYEQVKEQLPITTFIYKKQSDGNFGLDEVKIQ